MLPSIFCTVCFLPSVLASSWCTFSSPRVQSIASSWWHSFWIDTLVKRQSSANATDPTGLKQPTPWKCEPDSDQHQRTISAYHFFLLLQLIGITDGYLSLLDDSGDVREDLKIPEGDLGKEIESKHEAGEEILVSTVTSQRVWDVFLCMTWCLELIWFCWTKGSKLCLGTVLLI